MRKRTTLGGLLVAMLMLQQAPAHADDSTLPHICVVIPAGPHETCSACVTLATCCAPELVDEYPTIEGCKGDEPVDSILYVHYGVGSGVTVEHRCVQPPGEDPTCTAVGTTGVLGNGSAITFYVDDNDAHATQLVVVGWLTKICVEIYPSTDPVIPIGDC